MNLTFKEELILRYLLANSATCAEIGEALLHGGHGRREWANSALRNMHRKGLVYTKGRAKDAWNGRSANIWHIDRTGVEALMDCQP